MRGPNFDRVPASAGCHHTMQLQFGLGGTASGRQPRGDVAEQLQMTHNLLVTHAAAIVQRPGPSRDLAMSEWSPTLSRNSKPLSEACLLPVLMLQPIRPPAAARLRHVPPDGVRRCARLVDPELVVQCQHARSAPSPRSSKRHVSSVPTGSSMQVAKVKSPWKSSAATVGGIA